MKLYRPVGNKTLIPVGMVIFTYTKTNPSTWFGGTWEQLSGGYLYLCSSSTEKTTYTGTGTQSTTLTVNQIPSHGHYVKWANDDPNNGNRLTISYPDGSNTVLNISSWAWGQSSVNGNVHAERTGGGQGHTHNIATVGFFAWRRTA